MEGFDAGEREIPTPPVEVTDDTRARMAETVMAIMFGATPEQLTGYLQDGFPAKVTEQLERPGERDEMNAHIDLLLCVLHAPVEPAGV